MELKPSIMVRLMGLDDMSSQGESLKRGKVLSEKYFRKVAFIGVRERRRSPDHCSSLMKSPERYDEYSDFFSEMGKHKKENLDRCLSDGKTLSSSFVEAPENSFHFKASEFVLFKTWFGREENQKSRDSYSRCSSRKSRHISIGSPWHDFKNEAIGQSLRSSQQEVEDISREVKFRSCPKLNFCSKDSFSLHKEETRQISERWKMVKDFEDLGQSSRGCWTLGEMISMHDHSIGFPFLNQNPCEFVNKDRHGTSTNFCRHPRMRMKETISHSNNRFLASAEVGLTNKTTVVTKEDLHQGKTLSGSIIDSQSSHSAGVESNSPKQELESSNKIEIPSTKDLTIQNSSVIHKEQKKKKKKIWDLSWTKTTAPYLSINLHHSTTNHTTENTAKLDELVVIPEEGVVSSDCCSDTESSKSIIESCQHSPYSVLEPFQDSPSSSLSDDRSEILFHPFSMLSPSSTIPKEKEESDRVGKKRDFQYFSYVLTQSGFHGLPLIQAFRKWHSPINPLVFETLEKEYCEEKSWRSERKILFDRINLGLYEIFHRYTGFFSPPTRVSTMMSSNLWCEVTEELLWNLLFRQEEETKKNPSSSVVEADFELMDSGEYVYFIAVELENVLVDELAAEFLRW